MIWLVVPQIFMFFFSDTWDIMGWLVELAVVDPIINHQAKSPDFWWSHPQTMIESPRLKGLDGLSSQKSQAGRWFHKLFMSFLGELRKASTRRQQGNKAWSRRMNNHEKPIFRSSFRCFRPAKIQRISKIGRWSTRWRREHRVNSPVSACQARSAPPRKSGLIFV